MNTYAALSMMSNYLDLNCNVKENDYEPFVISCEVKLWRKFTF